MDVNRPPSYDVSDYLGMVRRHWWLVALLTAVGVAGAAGFARTQPQVYESATSVLVMPTGGQDANAAGGRTSGPINLDTEAQLVVSTDIATAAGQLLQVPTPPDQLAAHVTVTVPANTTVLTIAYAAPTPKEARAGSHAFATAYLQNRQNSAQADLTSQITALDGKVKQYAATLSQLSTKLAQLSSNDPARAELNSQVSTLTSQVNNLTSRENQLATTTVTAGKIISDATLPSSPTRPRLSLFLASGAMLGLLLGLGLALLRERLDTRVRRAVDVTRRADVAVLGLLPRRATADVDDVYPPYSAAGRMFHRLRNEVLASLPALPRATVGVPSRGAPASQVVVVTGASRGPAATVVAANLAAALARSGGEVLLICAHLPDSLTDVAPTTRLLGVAALPGLCDALAGRVDLDEAIQQTPRYPSLRVITTGGTASAGGLLQSQAFRDALAELREEADYLVVDAPSTASGADAQGLASLADAAILAVELRRTHHAEVVDAAEQLRRVGTPLLGAVVLPRLPRPTAPAGSEPGAAPPPAADPTADPIDEPDDEPAADGTPAKVRHRRRPTAPRLGSGTPGPGQVEFDLSGDDTQAMPKLDDETLDALAEADK